jgi:hypothetical protein
MDPLSAVSFRGKERAVEEGSYVAIIPLFPLEVNNSSHKNW